MNEDSIFDVAVEISDPGERNAYLRGACGDDVPLRNAIEALLLADGARNPLDRPLVAADATDSFGHFGMHGIGIPRQMSLENQVIAGRYRLGRILGEGGMGTVYLADQIHPVQRAVAVKLIRPGMGSLGVISRFEAERQVLAVMDHPGIARVFDAGTLPTGQPFFVMEYVDGLPLTPFCDDRKLTVPDRLRLFVEICNAVQHAHQKGVIHRDLKPGNILVKGGVAEGQFVPEPKIIDFGLAKALTGGVLPDLSLDESVQVKGTPLYMAPEQARESAPDSDGVRGHSRIDIDTRADIYSLGVVLYELIAGTTPIDRYSARQSSLESLLRSIREVDPPRPSDRLKGDRLAKIHAERRGTDLSDLTRMIRGELDWIVMKAIAKDRAARYETAMDFARDVGRYLRNEPVSAGPPSRSYILKKFVRRHRGPVVAAAAVLIALVAGIVGTAWGLVRAESARRNEIGQRSIADRRRLEAETSEVRAIGEAARANREAMAAEQVSGFLIGLFETPDRLSFMPINLGFRTTATNRSRSRDFLDLGVERLSNDNALKEQPVVRARLMNEIATISLSLGQLETARTMAGQALSIRRGILTADHPDLLKTLRLVALLEFLDGGFETCVDRHREIIALLESTGEIASDSARLELADTLASLACCLSSTSRTEAGTLAERAYGIYRSKLGTHEIRTVSTGILMALLKIKDDPLGSAAVAIRLKSDLNSTKTAPELSALLHDVFEVVRATGTPRETAVFRKLCDRLTVVFGESHFVTIRARTRLAGLLYDTSANGSPALEEAEAIYREISERGPKWERTYSRLNRARTLMRLQRHEEAAVCLESTVAEYRTQSAALNANHLPHALQLLAWESHRSADPEARKRIGPLLEESVVAARSNPGTTPARLGANLVDLGRYRLSQTPPIASPEIFEEAVRILRKVHGPTDLRTLEAMAYHSTTLRLSGRPVEYAIVRKQLEAVSRFYADVRQPEAGRIRQLLKGRIPVWR